MRILFSIVLLFLTLQVSCFAQQGTIQNPYRHFVQMIAQIDAKDTFNYTFHRIVYDFNNDGMPDVALSTNDTWGNAGGEWTIYFMQVNKKYVKGNVELKQQKGKKKIAGNLFFDPATTSIKKEQTGKSCFIIYHRMSCCDGNIAYYNIYKNKLQLYKSEYIHSSKINKGFTKKINSVLKKGVRLKEEIGDLNCMSKEKKERCWHKK